MAITSAQEVAKITDMLPLLPAGLRTKQWLRKHGYPARENAKLHLLAMSVTPDEYASNLEDCYGVSAPHLAHLLELDARECFSHLARPIYNLVDTENN